MTRSVPNSSNWTRPVLTLLAACFFCTACGLVSYRAYRTQSTPGAIVDSRFDKNSAFRDFHNAVYYPVRAFLTGENPYSPQYLDYHPDGLGFPAFYPSTLAIHAPFGFFQVEVAQWLYLGFNFSLMIFVVRMSLRIAGREPALALTFGLAGIFVLTRPGVLNFYGVQVTLLHVLGCLLAIEYGRDRPKLAALGLLLASCKPTFTIPLAILMLCRGDWRAVTYGTLLSLIVGGATLGIIAQNNGGFEAIANQAKTAYLASDGQLEIPEVVTSWTRIDVYSVLPRLELSTPNSKIELAIFAAIIGIGAICVFAEREEEQFLGAQGRFGLIAILTILISVYHQPYDALLLIPPIILLFFSSSNSVPVCGRALRVLLLLLLIFPMINFVGTQMMLNRLEIAQGATEWKIIVTANAIALSAAFCLVGLRMLGSRLGVESRPNH